VTQLWQWKSVGPRDLHKERETGAGTASVGSFRSFRYFELPAWVDTGNCSVERPCFLLDHIKPPVQSIAAEPAERVSSNRCELGQRGSCLTHTRTSMAAVLVVTTVSLSQGARAVTQLCRYFHYTDTSLIRHHQPPRTTQGP
jgi:hypothetical protein